MEQVFYPKFSRVAITGGTHGNEMSGIYIVREMLKHNIDQIGSLSVTPILANPPAIEACRRYIDTDLNRCFTDVLLSTRVTDSSPLEQKRAHELNSLLGPKGSDGAMDLVCDLHNTTSNMGICFIYDSMDWISPHIVKYVQTQMPSAQITVVSTNTNKANCYSLDSVGKHGLAIEVGPQPNGVLRADIYNMMKQALDHTLDWLNKFNAGTTFEGGELEIFVLERSVDYPRDTETSELTAIVHPQLQDNDFKLLQSGDPIFKTFTGETVNYEGEDLFPFFINEAAYYEKKIAFHLGKKKTITLPPISVKTD